MKANKQSYKLVLSILDKIANTPSTNVKKSIIAKYAENQLFQKVVFYALDPFKTFKMAGNISSTGTSNKNEWFVEAFAYLDKFALVPALTKKEKEDFSYFVQDLGDEAVELFNRILNKDLRCGANVKLFRAASDVFESLPVFHPMKGESDLAGFYSRAKFRMNICWSYKLDGTRCWAIVNLDTETCQFLSFNGLEIPNFQVLTDSCLWHARHLRQKYPDDFGSKIIFDGEVVNIKGDFAKHMSEFRRLHNMDASGFRYRIFDVVVENVSFKQRYEKYLVNNNKTLRPWFPSDIDLGTLEYTSDRDKMACKVAYLPHYELAKHPNQLAKQAVELGLEGIMLKTWTHEYQHKRSWDWCKVKPQYSEDLKVVDKFAGTGKYKESLGGLVVERAGKLVKVGSGFSDEQRRIFWQNPPKMIEVEYQEVTDKGSLRFPRFKRVREDK